MTQAQYSREICVDVWGDFACFTQADTKTERVTYDIPTPSACRGILSAIYAKPAEFYYEIRKIEVMKPVKRIGIKRNEVARKADKKLESIDVEAERTQRGTVFLKNVYYRIHALIIMRNDADERVNIEKLYNEFKRRVRKGKCFYQPYLGTRECLAYFSEPDPDKVPINQTEDFGMMLYDIFDISDNVPLDTENNTGKTNIKYYHAYMENGVIRIPSYETIKGGET